jgi:4'-phosphopantetheinyl transferase EntD
VPLRSELETPHGRCAIVELADDALDGALAQLPELERARAGELSPVRRREFITGRTALHALIGDAAIAVGDRGGPLAAGWTCSISHKGARAVALAAPAGDGFVGVDLEHVRPPRVDIAARILTPREPRATGAALLRVFAIKEAIYKAIDPIVRRYVKFTEVELDADGGVTSALPAAIEAWAIELDGFWLATARARPH